MPVSNVLKGESSNRHCSVVEIRGRGILIEGQSGSGKTSLAFGLLERAGQIGINAAFVCDDQALLDSADGRLIARAPDSIAGKAELRGFGIVDVPYKSETVIHGVVRLTDDARVERMPQTDTVNIAGIDVSLIEVPERHERQAVRIVFAWIGEGKLNPGS